MAGRGHRGHLGQGVIALLFCEAHRPPSGFAPSKLQALIRLAAAASAGDVLQFDMDQSSGVADNNAVGSQTGGLSVARAPDDTAESTLFVVALSDGAGGDRIQGLVTGFVRAAVCGQVSAGDELVVTSVSGRGALCRPTSTDERKAVRAVAIESGGVPDETVITILPVLFDGDDPIGDVHFPAQSRFIEAIIEQDNIGVRREFGTAGADATPRGTATGGGGGGSFSGGGQIGPPAQGIGDGNGGVVIE